MMVEHLKRWMQTNRSLGNLYVNDFHTINTILDDKFVGDCIIFKNGIHVAFLIDKYCGSVKAVLSDFQKQDNLLIYMYRIDGKETIVNTLANDGTMLEYQSIPLSPLSGDIGPLPILEQITNEEAPFEDCWIDAKIQKPMFLGNDVMSTKVQWAKGKDGTIKKNVSLYYSSGHIGRIASYISCYGSVSGTYMQNVVAWQPLIKKPKIT